MLKNFVFLMSFAAAALFYGCTRDNPLGPVQSPNDPSTDDLQTFVLKSAADSRLPAPEVEDREATPDEWLMLQEMMRHGRHGQHPAPADDPSIFWNSATTSFGIKANFPPPKLARAYALVHVAIYDALAARHARHGHRLISSVVGAGAGATVLLYLFPADSVQILNSVSLQLQADSNLSIRKVMRSWVLGRIVGQLVVERGKHDNSDAVYTGTPPTGDGIWTGTNPVLPMTGMWQTWITTSGSEFQPKAPYVFGSHEDSVDVQEVLDSSLHRTADQIAIVHKWADLPPPTIWNISLKNRITSNNLNSFRSARAYAYLNVAMYDAFISCWLTKYAYWIARPFQRIPGLTTVIKTPNFPTYSSGHSTVSAAAAQVLSELFPSEQAFFDGEAHEAAMSRLLGGIHFRHDNEQGLAVGKKIGRKVVHVMRHDRSMMLAEDD